MEVLISVILVFMIIGAIYALHAEDLLSAVIAQGIIGYGLVICFLLLKAPDLAIVQIVVETITENVNFGTTYSFNPVSNSSTQIIKIYY